MTKSMQSTTVMLVVAVVVTLASLPTTKAQCFTQNDTTAKVTADRLYYGQRKFSISLLDALQKAKPGQSLFFSPHSTYRALLLAYFGANGETEDALAQTLHLDWAKNKAEVSQAYQLEKTARENRVQHQTVEFSSVDKIYVAKETNLRSCMKEMFAENIEQLDFVKDSEKCRAQINGFVANVTKGNIKDLLVPGSISEATNVVLANAAFFKGLWASKFDKEDTELKIFYEHGRMPVYVETMKQRGTFNYGIIDKLNTVTLEMPYKGEDGSISMFIFLPVFTTTAIDELLAGLTREILDEVLSGGLEREVEVEFPKISFERSFELMPVLKHMGIGNLFDSNSDLSGFSEKNDLKFDDAVHKAKIEIDEEGSTAAAATAIFSFRSSRPTEPAQFKCNHPFMFLIHDQKSKEILFAGVYRGPNE